MLFNLSKVFSATLIAASIMVMHHSPAKAEYEHGSINQGGCYRAGDEQIKFITQVVSTNTDNVANQPNIH